MQNFCSFLPISVIHVVIEVRMVKLGRNFAFVEAEAKYAATGKFIATGKHTKYLGGMTLVQKVALGRLLPLTSAAAQFVNHYRRGIGSNAIAKPGAANGMTIPGITAFDLNETCDTGSICIGAAHCNPNRACHGGYQVS